MAAMTGPPLNVILEESADSVSWRSVLQATCEAGATLWTNGWVFRNASTGHAVSLFVTPPSDNRNRIAMRLRMPGVPGVWLIGPGPPGVGP